MLGKWIVGCAALVAFFTLAAQPATASVDDFVGRWTSQNASGDVTSIHVTRSGAGVRLQVFARCQPQQSCGWGEVPAFAFAPNALGNPDRDAVALMARADTPVSRRTIIIHLTSGGARYEVFTDFTDSQRRANHVETGDLRRLVARVTPPSPRFTARPTQVPGENCIAVNQASLRLVNEGGQWKIMDGARQVHQFGAEHDAAERALALIQFYGFTLQCFVPLISPVVANPNPVMTMMYWRRGDTVPAFDYGAPSLNCTSSFYAPSVRVEQTANGAWRVIAGTYPLLDFGADRALAERAVAVIHHYNLTRKCFIYDVEHFPGSDSARMQYWLTGQ